MQIINSGILFENIQLTLSGTSPADAHFLTPNSLEPDKLSSLAKKLAQFNNIKKVKINYILVKGINDHKSDLEYLIQRFKDSSVILKISYLNKTRNSAKFGLKRGSLKTAEVFKKELAKNGIDSFIFGSFKNIGLSCGQLKILGV